MRFTKYAISLLLLSALLLSFSSCGDRIERDGDIHTSDLPEAELNQLFKLTKTPDGFIGQVGAIQTTDSGDILLFDPSRNSLHHFSEDGSYVGLVGGPGGRAGQFLNIRNMIITGDDTLLTYDSRLARHTVFERSNDSWAVVDTFSFAPPTAGAIHQFSDGRLVLMDIEDHRIDENLFRIKHNLRVSVPGADLPAAQHTYRGRELMVKENMLPIEKPFSYTSLTAVDPDKNFYILNTEQFELVKFNSELEPADTLYAPVARQPLSENDRRDAMLSVGTEFRSIVPNYLPNTKPVARGFWVDDEQNIWIRTHDSPQYLVLDREGAPITSFDLPRGFRAVHLSGNRIYAVATRLQGDETAVFEVNLPS